MLDPVIHQATRLRILAALHKNRDASFASLRDALGLTDGNLASHAERLVEAGYVEARRALVDLHFEVRYRITARGSDAFRAYIGELRSLLPIDEDAQAAEGRVQGAGDASPAP